MKNAKMAIIENVLCSIVSIERSDWLKNSYSVKFKKDSVLTFLYPINEVIIEGQ